MYRLRLFVASAERTTYHQELLDRMERIDQTNKLTKILIERVRKNAQPNKAHRSEESLLSDNAEVNERFQYAKSLRDLVAGGLFTDTPELNTYFSNLAESNEDLNRSHEKFLRQVQQFCIKELKKFTDEIYVTIKNAYAELGLRRDAYDLARHKLKICRPEDIEKKGDSAALAQKEFEQAAMALHELLLKTPEYHQSIANATYLYTRAELDYAKRIKDTFDHIQRPTANGIDKKKPKRDSKIKTTKGK